MSEVPCCVSSSFLYMCVHTYLKNCVYTHTLCWSILQLLRLLLGFIFHVALIAFPFCNHNGCIEVWGSVSCWPKKQRITEMTYFKFTNTWTPLGSFGCNLETEKAKNYVWSWRVGAVRENGLRWRQRVWPGWRVWSPGGGRQETDLLLLQRPRGRMTATSLGGSWLGQNASVTPPPPSFEAYPKYAQGLVLLTVVWSCSLVKLAFVRSGWIWVIGSDVWSKNLALNKPLRKILIQILLFGIQKFSLVV